MVFVLVLCGLVIGVYLLLIALLLVAGFYGVFGAIVYGPFFIIRYIWRVFDGEDALEKSYDVRKPKKVKRVREPREVEGIAGLHQVKKTRLVAGTAGDNRASSKVRKVGEVVAGGNGVFSTMGRATNSTAKKEGKLPSLKKTTNSAAKKSGALSSLKKDSNSAAKKSGKLSSLKKVSSSNKTGTSKGTASTSNPKPQGITTNSLTTSSLSDYPDMV